MAIPASSKRSWAWRVSSSSFAKCRLIPNFPVWSRCGAARVALGMSEAELDDLGRYASAWAQSIIFGSE